MSFTLFHLLFLGVVNEATVWEPCQSVGKENRVNLLTSNFKHTERIQEITLGNQDREV